MAAGVGDAASRPYTKIGVARAGGVETITLSVPERRNAIGSQMTNELLWALGDASAAEDVRVVVLTGLGKAFCAGGDFQQMTGGEGATVPLAPKGDYADLLLAMTRFEKPLVAKVNGHAMGGGLGLVCACTFAIASTEAKLGTPEIQVGLFPMMIMAVLARLVPRRRLLRMMLLGERVSAEEGATIGLVNEAVPPEELDRATDALVGALLEKSSMTLKLGLRAFAAQDDLNLAEALPMLRARLAECLGTEDAREGLLAFLEKRAPVWTGK
jgi:enoyl-CoA hydratase/carnithine racemase